MHPRPLGLIVSAAVTALLAQPSRAADKPAAKADGKTAGSCVHNCSGYAACKTATNSCKGKNDCAGAGLVPKECSSKTSPEECKKVLDPKKNTMCTWLTK